MERFLLCRSRRTFFFEQHPAIPRVALPKHTPVMQIRMRGKVGGWRVGQHVFVCVEDGDLVLF